MERFWSHRYAAALPVWTLFLIVMSVLLFSILPTAAKALLGVTFLQVMLAVAAYFVRLRAAVHPLPRGWTMAAASILSIPILRAHRAVTS